MLSMALAHQGRPCPALRDDDTAKVAARSVQGCCAHMIVGQIPALVATAGVKVPQLYKAAVTVQL